MISITISGEMPEVKELLMSLPGVLPTIKPLYEHKCDCKSSKEMARIENLYGEDIKCCVERK